MGTEQLRAWVISCCGVAPDWHHGWIPPWLAGGMHGGQHAWRASCTGVVYRWACGVHGRGRGSVICCVGIVQGGGTDQGADGQGSRQGWAGSSICAHDSGYGWALQSRTVVIYNLSRAPLEVAARQVVSTVDLGHCVGSVVGVHGGTGRGLEKEGGYRAEC